jgi:hypothetical protein
MACLMLIAGRPAESSPIITTADCDNSGQYVCLTNLENFEVDEEVYNVNFVPGNLLTVFGVDTTGTLQQILDQLQPLETAVFWNDREGAETFASALADLLTINDIDGFVCPGTCGSSFGFGWSYEGTYIPVYLETTSNVEVADCYVGTSHITGDGVHHCVYNPSSNTQNWAVISRVSEPDTLALVGVGLTGLGYAKRRSRKRPMPI